MATSAALACQSTVVTARRSGSADLLIILQDTNMTDDISAHTWGDALTTGWSRGAMNKVPVVAPWRAAQPER
jgi:predicted transposase YbfD/YdcC